VSNFSKMLSESGAKLDGAHLREFVVNSPENPPPFYYVTATTPFDVGVQHGVLAKERIRAWIDSVEMQSLFDWIAMKGTDAFAEMKRVNGVEFPAYVDEMKGIASGADVTLDQVWVLNLINDLENLMTQSGTPRKPGEVQKGCSDEYAVSPDGYSAGFAHGHNDDWSPIAKQFWYFMAVEPQPGARDVHSMAGVVYPGTLVGWSPTWNKHGVLFTQNTLLPVRSRPDGLACAFVQRRAIITAEGMDDVIAGLTVPGWSDGASMNVVDVRGKRMANVELWEEAFSARSHRGDGQLFAFQRIQTLDKSRWLSS